MTSDLWQQMSPKIPGVSRATAAAVLSAVPAEQGAITVTLEEAGEIRRMYLHDNPEETSVDEDMRNSINTVLSRRPAPAPLPCGCIGTCQHGALAPSVALPVQDDAAVVRAMWEIVGEQAAGSMWEALAVARRGMVPASRLEGMHSTEDVRKAMWYVIDHETNLPSNDSFVKAVLALLTAKSQPDPAVEEFNKHIRRNSTGAYVLTDSAEKIVAQIRDAIRKEAADGK